MQITIHPTKNLPVQAHIGAIKLVRNLSGKSLTESKDLVDRQQDITLPKSTWMSVEDVEQMISAATRVGVNVTVTDAPIKKITLDQAIDKAAVTTYQGLMMSYLVADGIAHVYTIDSAGQESKAYFLADQEIDISEDGSACVTDIDGHDDHVFMFYVPMAG
jgi:hypothetical protein